MLTQANVRELKKHLEETLIICNSMLQTREFQKLFTSEKDYRDCKVASEIVPDNFYRVRIFDVSIELRHNSRTKNYYIYCEQNNLPFSLQEFNKYFKEYKLFNEFKAQQSHYYFTLYDDLDFDKCVYAFKKFVIYYLSKTCGELFLDIF